MQKEKFYEELKKSSFHPTFQFTEDLYLAVNNILEPHEDYFLRLHKEFCHVMDFFKELNVITVNDMLDMQRLLFNKKISKIEDVYLCSIMDFSNLSDRLSPSEQRYINLSKEFFSELASRADTLPNLHITLGLRNLSVKVGDWIPPLFFNHLLEDIFPIRIDEIDNILEFINNFYTIFQHIHPLNDLNGRVGGMLVNLISLKKENKYVIK